LVRKPDSVAAYDKFTRLGWNGPYLDSADQNYLNDAWGNPYSYDANSRIILSASTTPNITMTF